MLKQTKTNFMKVLISPMWRVVMASMALLGELTLVAGEPSPSISAAAPSVPEKAASQASPAQLLPGVADVLKLAHAKIGDETIVAFVKSSKTAYYLSANDVVYLRGQGVSDRVITAMLNQPRAATQTWASMAAQEANSGASAPAVTQTSTTHVQAAPVYVSPPPAYVYPAPAYSYYDSYPYYHGGYWGIPFPRLSLSFGFGHGFHGGGFHGGFHGRGHRW
jgi:hypothetical protein